MVEVVINNCHGGFGLSDEAFQTLIEDYGWAVTEYDGGQYADDDARIVDNTSAEDLHLTTIAGEYTLINRRDGDLRTDPDLIAVVRELGGDASGRHADLKVVEVPDDAEWEIDEYDGNEWVAEKHRTWS